MGGWVTLPSLLPPPKPSSVRGSFSLLMWMWSAKWGGDQVRSSDNLGEISETWRKMWNDQGVTCSWGNLWQWNWQQMVRPTALVSLRRQILRGRQSDWKSWSSGSECLIIIWRLIFDPSRLILAHNPHWYWPFSNLEIKEYTSSLVPTLSVWSSTVKDQNWILNFPEKILEK